MKRAETYRPIELVHDFRFIPCCFPQDVELPSPRERLDRLKALGYGGVALCPSYADYLSESSFAKTVDIIKYAREIGLTVWIYDEKYYPSGSADGAVAKEDPRYGAKAICALVGEPDGHGVICVNSPHGYGSVLYAFACNVDGDGAPDFATLRDVTDHKTFGGGILLDCKGERNVRVYAFFGKCAFEFATTSHNTRGIRRYTDTLMPDATKAFLSRTYGGYESLGRLSDYVEAVFTDEPQIPALCRTDYRSDYAEYLKSIESAVFVVRDEPDGRVAFSPYLPWTVGFPDAFESRHGYSLIPHLPRLFFDEGDEGGRVRADFWETASALFGESYGGVYSEFCRERGVAYSGHLLYEEEFENHPYMHGDPLYQLGLMDIPGCDMLFASPCEILKHASAVKLAASAAMLYGKNDVMIEASNIVKDVFPITEGAFKLATALETALGATRFLSYYTETAMEPDAVKRCCDFTERLLLPLAGFTPERRVFVYLPDCDIRSEAMPSVSVSDKKPMSEKLSAIKSFLNETAEKLPQMGYDICYINGEKIAELLDSDECVDKALILPPYVEKPECYERFGVVVRCGDIWDSRGVEDIAGFLEEFDYRNAVTDTESRFVIMKKTSEKTDAFLVVNLGEDFKGNITLNTEKELDCVTVYSPHTNRAKRTVCVGDKVRFVIHKNECRIIFVGEIPEFPAG